MRHLFETTALWGFIASSSIDLGAPILPVSGITTRDVTQAARRICPAIPARSRIAAIHISLAAALIFPNRQPNLTVLRARLKANGVTHLAISGPFSLDIAAREPSATVARISVHPVFRVTMTAAVGFFLTLLLYAPWVKRKSRIAKLRSCLFGSFAHVQIVKLI